MLILKNLNLRFGDQIIFDDLDAAIAYDEKIGLLGRNGTGKSTLLRAIAGKQHLDSGTITYDKKRKIGYLPQEVVLQSSKTVYDEAFSVFDEFISLSTEKIDLETKLSAGLDAAHAAECSTRYAKVLELITDFDTNRAIKETQSILKGLGFSESGLQQEVATLSVGWQMRVVLAKLLLQNADFYLFDEPTNHLDLQTKEWFLHFLKDASCGYLLVTHDRHFLERACEKIIELERGKARRYTGNFSMYLKQKNDERERLLAAKVQQDKEIARKQATIERFRYKATKRGMVKSMEKQLDKMDIIEIEPPLPTVNFSFAPVARSGKVVLTLDHVSHSFGTKKIFENLSAEIVRGQKVALIAPNGMGKTTLFNLITGKLPLQQGSIQFGHNVEPAYFEQEQARVLKPNNTVLQEVLEACPRISESKIRSFLGSFLFSGDDVEKKIHQLSGGERNRVAMVKILLQDANMLLLDEPTNHLDLYAKEVLLQALQQYQGTMILVSHDHDFIQKVATAIMELTPYGLHVYDGDYESFLYYKKMMHTNAEQKSCTKKEIKKEVPKERSKDSAKQLRDAEQRVEKLETKYKKLVEHVAQQYGTADYQKLAQQLQAVQKELDEAMAHWDNLVDQW
ncbi:MAG: ABC-F family ATP-binding cassette domain-containing protein [Candidatus Babeliales bacterium]